MAKDIIVIYIKNETILILISLKRYFSHPELKSSLTVRRHCNSGPKCPSCFGTRSNIASSLEEISEMC